jgi:hypothetical protein
VAVQGRGSPPSFLTVYAAVGPPKFDPSIPDIRKSEAGVTLRIGPDDPKRFVPSPIGIDSIADITLLRL